MIRLSLFATISMMALAACAEENSGSSAAPSDAPEKSAAPQVQKVAKATEPAAQEAATSATDEVTPDAEKGAKVFRICNACHSFNPAQRRPGPHLKGVLGRKAGTVEGFRYSKAMKEADIVWSEENIGPYVLNPRSIVPGTSMAARLPRESDVPHLIAYLKQQADAE